MNEKMPTFELLVIDGPQRGARQPLPIACKKTVAALGKGDIVFNDGSDDANQLELVAGKAGVMLYLVAGDAVCDNHCMEIGERYTLAPNTAVRFGQTTFTIVDTSTEQTSAKESSTSEQTRDSDTHQESISHGSFASVSSAVSDFPHIDFKLLLSSYKSVESRHFKLVLLLGIGLLIAGTSAMTTGAFSGSASVVQEAPSLMFELKEMGFTDLQMEKNEQGRVRLSGYVIDREQQQKLLSAVDNRQEDVELDITLTSDLHEAVANVYRINNVDAEVLPMEAGSVRVKTQTSDIALLEQIEAGVAADVPQLVSLDRENSLPEEISTLSPRGAEPVEDPDKRVIMVVAGDPSYVVTQDNSRYFVGSLLPTGHTIESIKEKIVIVEKSGVSTTLEF